MGLSLLSLAVRLNSVESRSEICAAVSARFQLDLNHSLALKQADWLVVK